MLKIISLCIVILVCPAMAIVVQDYDAAESAPSELNWDFVYQYKGASGVAVGGPWLLTAAHVAYGTGSADLSIGGLTYNQEEIVFHDAADLALVRFDRALPGQYSLYTFEDLVDRFVLMVGYGTTGTALEASWTDSGAGAGVERWGSQIVSMAGTHRSRPDGVVYVSTSGYWMHFNRGDTVNEAGAGSGDSGGGVFYNDNGLWKLTGVITGRTSGTYTSTFTASMSDYSGWIYDTVPEPATIGFMSCSMFGLLFLRRFNHRKQKMFLYSFRNCRRDFLCDSFCTSNISDTEAVNILTVRDRISDILSKLWGLLRILLRPVYTWEKKQTVLFWNRIVLMYENCAIREGASVVAMERFAVQKLDSFLEWIGWDHLVQQKEAWTGIIRRGYRERSVRTLDVFLDKVFWDKAMSAFDAIMRNSKSNSRSV